MLHARSIDPWQRVYFSFVFLLSTNCTRRYLRRRSINLRKCSPIEGLLFEAIGLSAAELHRKLSMTTTRGSTLRRLRDSSAGYLTARYMHPPLEKLLPRGLFVVVYRWRTIDRNFVRFFRRRMENRWSRESSSRDRNSHQKWKIVGVIFLRATKLELDQRFLRLFCQTLRNFFNRSSLLLAKF